MDGWVSVIPVSFEIKITQAMIFGLHWVPCIEDILREKAALLCLSIRRNFRLQLSELLLQFWAKIILSCKKKRRVSQGEFNFNWHRCVFLKNNAHNKQTKPLGFLSGSSN